MSTGHPAAPDRRVTLALTAAGFAAFFLLSWAWPAARQIFPSNVPPLFVRWHPLVGPLLLVPVAMGAGLWLLLPKLMRLPRARFLVILVMFTWLFAETLAMQSGRARTFNNCCVEDGFAASLTTVLQRPEDYFHDVSLVQRLGPREFGRRYPTIVRTDAQGLSIHSGTHPPGASVLEWAMWRLTGRSTLAVAILIALIGALGVLPAQAIAGELYEERTARVAAVLFACAPGVLLFSATSGDAIFMTLTGVAMAALVRAPRSDAWAIGAGALSAVALAFTWGALALFPVGLGVALLGLRDHAPKTIIRRVGLAVAGLAAGWLIIRSLTGIDLIADFAPAVHRQVTFLTYRRSYVYWSLGNVVAFLFVVGVVNTGSIVSSTVTRWRERRPGMETVLWATLALTSISSVFKGETDHNWLFFMPLAIAVSAGAVVEAELRVGVAAGLGQAVLTEALFYTGW